MYQIDDLENNINSYDKNHVEYMMAHLHSLEELKNWIPDNNSWMISDIPLVQWKRKEVNY